MTRIKHNGQRVQAFVCVDTQEATHREVEIKARLFAVAGGPIESAKLFLHSKLDEGRPAAGRFLAEHIYYRGFISVPAVVDDPHEQFVNVLVPPQGTRHLQRYHINVQGEPDPRKPGHILLRLTGTAAMDPSEDNRVTLSAEKDKYGVPKASISFKYSRHDESRIREMRHTMQEVAAALGGNLEEGFTYVRGTTEEQKHDEALKFLAHGGKEEEGITYLEKGRSLS